MTTAPRSARDAATDRSSRSDDALRRTDELVPLGGVPFSSPGALFRIGERLGAFEGELWTVDDGGAEQLPVTIASAPVVGEIDGSWYVGGAGLWRTDGTAAGTEDVPGFDKLADLADVAELFTEPLCDGIVAVDHRLVVEGRVLDVPAFERVDAGASFDGACYFTALDVVDGRGRHALWRVAAGGEPSVVAELPGLPADGEIAATADHLVFRATDDAGIEPRISDGTAAGTHRAWDLLPGTPSSSPSELTAAGGRVHFVARLHAVRDSEDETSTIGGDCATLCVTP